MTITQNTTTTDERVDQTASDEALEAFSDKVFTDILGTLSTFAGNRQIAKRFQSEPRSFRGSRALPVFAELAADPASEGIV